MMSDLKKYGIKGTVDAIYNIIKYADVNVLREKIQEWLITNEGEPV